jgi:hypothetical protein
MPNLYLEMKAGAREGCAKNKVSLDFLPPPKFCCPYLMDGSATTAVQLLLLFLHHHAATLLKNSHWRADNTK